MSDHAFCRTLLTSVMDDVKKHTTAEQRKAAWGYKYRGSQSAEFHGPEGYYWHGRACCAWHAKAKGWGAWLEEKGLEQ